MSTTAKKILDVARGWLGYSEANGKFKEILNVYNAYKPLARGYKMKTSDEWCDAFVSACAIKAGAVDIIGTEVSCNRHIDIFKKKGIWIEDGKVTPKPGDLILFNWDDKTQSNDGAADHIGFVEKVEGNKITCIEGNMNEAVGRRVITVGWGYIRGYARPKYGKETTVKTSTTTTKDTYTLKEFIKDIQKACGAKVDGIAGSETLSKTVTLSAKKNNRHAAVKFVQKRLYELGYIEIGTADGIAGPKFTSAVAHFQQDKGCTVDGEITARNKTWKKLLGM